MLITPALFLLAAIQVANGAALAPTGPHTVRTADFHWTDSSRADPLLEPRRPREIAVHVVYPDTKNAPTIVFATGRASPASNYASLAAELASQGYAVAIVESPHQSRVTLADGAEVPPAPSWQPTREHLMQFALADAVLEQMNATVSADLRFAARKLVELSFTGALAGSFSPGRLGMAGHSNGAMAGSRACAATPRCQAFLGIEGAQAREVRKEGNTKPFGLIISEMSLGYDAENIYREMLGTTKSDFTVYRVDGAGHNSVIDLMLTQPGLFTYPISPERGLQVERSLAVAFFDRTLKANGDDHDTKALPEVKVESAAAPPRVNGPGAYKQGGAEIVAILVIGPGVEELTPTLKSSVEQAFKRAREQAQKEGVAFRTIGISNGWSPEDGWQMLKAYGSFDEVNTGGNWLNMTVQQLAWRDSIMTPMVPQLLILRYTVDWQTRIHLGERAVVKRLQGYKAIQDWARGAELVP